jgi:hypothetical protein
MTSRLGFDRGEVGARLIRLSDKRPPKRASAHRSQGTITVYGSKATHSVKEVISVYQLASSVVTDLQDRTTRHSTKV